MNPNPNDPKASREGEYNCPPRCPKCLLCHHGDCAPHLADYVEKLHIITGPNGMCMCGTDGVTCSELLRRVSREIGDALLMHSLIPTQSQKGGDEPCPTNAEPAVSTTPSPCRVGSNAAPNVQPEGTRQGYSPFEDSMEYHQSIAGHAPAPTRQEGEGRASWRYLNAGEIIRPGDEWQQDWDAPWFPIPENAGALHTILDPKRPGNVRTRRPAPPEPTDGLITQLKQWIQATFNVLLAPSEIRELDFLIRRSAIRAAMKGEGRG